ncbi:MAG: flavodoxin family protein [Clostridia bacterium]|nr:flavodoxin family protein [Clostridia bacterium]
MKITVVLGSSKANSVSKKLAQRFIDGAKENGNEVVVYDVSKMNLQGCRGCGACRKMKSDCVINDDMQKYYKDLRESGALVVTSPNYYSQVCGPMITFMNRHYCLMDSDRNIRIPQGIKLIGIFAQGAPEIYPKYEPHYDWYLDTFKGKGMELIGRIIAGGDSDLSENGKLMNEAYNLGLSLK